MNKYVIYTVITGGFDEPKQPLVVDERFDYVLFSDSARESQNGIWQIKPIPYNTSDARKRSRYPKAYPELCMPQYEASLYIDGTIQISSKRVYDRFVELFNKGVEWAGIRHQWRNDIYAEMNAIILERWVHDYNVLNWYRFLRTEEYEKQTFMFENNIIFRRHTENVKKVNDIWWWSIENYVKRDQFSLMYALWKVPGIKTDFLLPQNENAWKNSGLFKYTNHNPHKRILPWSIWETIRHRCFRAAYGDNTSYMLLLDNISQYKHPKIMMHLWTAYALVRYGYRVVIEMIKCRLPKKKQ